MSQVVKMILAMIPVLKMAAALTSTTIDDKIVAVLEGLVANNGGNVDQIHASLKQQNIVT